MSKVCLTSEKINPEQVDKIKDIKKKQVDKIKKKYIPIINLKEEEHGWVIQGNYEELVQQYIDAGFDEAYAQERIDLGWSDFDF